MSKPSVLSRARRLVQRTGIAVLAAGTVSYGGVSFWTRHCHFEVFDPAIDNLFQHPILKAINPHQKPDSHDCCVRRLSFAQVDPLLLEDSRRGGTRLIEAFARGTWGGYGYGIQRRLMGFTRSEATKDDLWTKEELQKSKFEPDTFFTNHFQVLSKAPDSLILRGCFNPRHHPPQPQPVDNLLKMEVLVEEEKESVAFRFKCITFDGTEAASTRPDPFGGFAGWLHRLYATVLLEAGVGNCTRE